MAIVPPRKLPSPRKKSHRARRDLRRESAGGGRACQRICSPWDPSASESRKLRRLLHERAVAKACLWLPAPRRCAPCGKRLDQRSNVSRPWLLAFSCFRRWFPGTANAATSAGSLPTKDCIAVLRRRWSKLGLHLFPSRSNSSARTIARAVEMPWPISGYQESDGIIGAICTHAIISCLLEASQRVLRIFPKR